MFLKKQMKEKEKNYGCPRLSTLQKKISLKMFPLQTANAEKCVMSEDLHGTLFTIKTHSTYIRW